MTTDADRDPAASLGSVANPPVAWGLADGEQIVATSKSWNDVLDLQGELEFATKIVPLYRRPDDTRAFAEACRDEGIKTLTDEIAACNREIARLRLTDAERFVLKEVMDAYADNDDDISCGEIAAVIHGLLERVR